jgi:hypothetical protein
MAWSLLPGIVAEPDPPLPHLISPLLSSGLTCRSIEELFHRIISGVLVCQDQFKAADDLNSIITKRSLLYSHNPFIFFGVGLNAVRYAIETQSEALAMMIPSYFFSSFPLCENLPQYRPRCHLPTLASPSSCLSLGLS